MCAFSPIPQIRWKKADGELPHHRHAISMAGSFLHLFNLQYEDEGLYECEANNPKGSDIHKTHLFVEGENYEYVLHTVKLVSITSQLVFVCLSGAPEWVEKISSSERDIGGDYIMSCVVNGKPKPHVHFLKNGQKVQIQGTSPSCNGF